MTEAPQQALSFSTLRRRSVNRLIRLSGYPQEYLCLEASSLHGLIDWRLDGTAIDPADLLFLGYRPLVLAYRPGLKSDHAMLELRVGHKAVAGMKLQRLPQTIGDMPLYSGDHPWQRFLPRLAVPLDRLRQRLNMREAANVTKSMTEYDMVRIAYAQPREVHLAVVGSPEQCNIFPTDLHGRSHGDGYILSLRHSGQACAQVQQHRRLLLCRMDLDHYATVYHLGPRHMAGQERAQRIVTIAGFVHDHALPEGALDVQLLEVGAHIDVGIHRLFEANVAARKKIGEGPVLAHAHAAPLGMLKRKGHSFKVQLR